MREWLSRRDWRAEKRWWREQEAAARAKGGRSLVTADESAALPHEELQRLAFNRWMSLRFTGAAPAAGLVIIGDIATKQHQVISQGEQKK